MSEKIIVVDFGSKSTQLIARMVRSWNVYCEIYPCTASIPYDSSVKGFILSGSSVSVFDENAPKWDADYFFEKVPILGIGYGACKGISGLEVEIEKGEEDKAKAKAVSFSKDTLFEGVASSTEVWPDKKDYIADLPIGFHVLGRFSSGRVAAFKWFAGEQIPFYGLLFHPEVKETKEGGTIVKNFLVEICGCKQDWTPKTFVENAVNEIRKTVGDKRVVLALSGGVDSTVTAALIKRAVGDQLAAVFVNHGLLRKNEFEEVLDSYHQMKINVTGIDASARFYKALEGVEDPERKRKIIGKLFVDVFQEEAQKLGNVAFLGQGTIYPDIIESYSVGSASVAVKSHHNVGGLPEKMNLKLVEPLKFLFKDEVRKIGKEMDVPESFLKRHPFPGPGLGIRILGAITPERVKVLQEADAVFVNKLKEENLYDSVWQAGVILLPVRSVGVKDGKRTYTNAIALRAVSSIDAMTAQWVHLPYRFLEEVSTEIINRVEGVNRVTYDISSKPPATIEWE